jgi:hypothetical protein
MRALLIRVRSMVAVRRGVRLIGVFKSGWTFVIVLLAFVL